MKIFIKYCGGCSPCFNRVETAGYVKEKLEHVAEFVTAEDKNIDIVLAIQGCEAACADLRPFEGMKIVSVTSHEEAERFVSDVLEKRS